MYFLAIGLDNVEEIPSSLFFSYLSFLTVWVTTILFGHFNTSSSPPSFFCWLDRFDLRCEYIFELPLDELLAVNVSSEDLFKTSKIYCENLTFLPITELRLLPSRLFRLSWLDCCFFSLLKYWFLFLRIGDEGADSYSSELWTSNGSPSYLVWVTSLFGALNFLSRLKIFFFGV